jgi:hypothetical protein
MSTDFGIRWLETTGSDCEKWNSTHFFPDIRWVGQETTGLVSYDRFGFEIDPVFHPLHDINSRLQI